MHGKPHPQNLNPSTKWAEASRFQVGDSLGTIPILNLRFLAFPHLGFVHLFQEFAYSSGFCFVFTVWNYDPSKDSLLQVSKKDYDSCNTSSPIAVYKDGNTKVKLDRSGPFYFISGTRGNCEKGLNWSLWCCLGGVNSSMFLQHLLRWNSKARPWPQPAMAQV